MFKWPKSSNDQQLDDICEQYADRDDVHDARVVEFAGQKHVHVDLECGDIVVCGLDGKEKRVACQRPSDW